MKPVTRLCCACGQVCLEVEGTPIVSAECHCNSCREAGVKLQSLPAAPRLLEANGGTRFVLYRKDRIRFIKGLDQLEEHRLKPGAKTRRVVANCCSTPMFLEFESGHWLSLYAGLWPNETAPRPETRTMTIDLASDAHLDDDVPNSKRQSFGFFAKLLGAWIAMGFRTPKISLTTRS